MRPTKAVASDVEGFWRRALASSGRVEVLADAAEHGMLGDGEPLGPILAVVEQCFVEAVVHQALHLVPLDRLALHLTQQESQWISSNESVEKWKSWHRQA